MSIFDARPNLATPGDYGTVIFPPSFGEFYETFAGMAEEYRSVLPPYHLISACSHFIWRCFSRPAGLGPGRARGTGGN